MRGMFFPPCRRKDANWLLVQQPERGCTFTRIDETPLLGSNFFRLIQQPHRCRQRRRRRGGLSPLSSLPGSVVRIWFLGLLMSLFMCLAPSGRCLRSMLNSLRSALLKSVRRSLACPALLYRTLALRPAWVIHVTCNLLRALGC